MQVIEIAYTEAGLVIGRGGETVRRIQMESGCRVDVDGDEGCVKLRGAQSALLQVRGRALRNPLPEFAYDRHVEMRATTDSRGGSRGGCAGQSRGAGASRGAACEGGRGVVLGR